jgi:hypothetical protein
LQSALRGNEWEIYLEWLRTEEGTEKSPTQCPTIYLPHSRRWKGLSSNGRRTLSASARKKMSLAQKARWSRARSGAQPQRDSENDGRGTRESLHVSMSPEEDRRRSETEMGESESGEEGGVKHSARIKLVSSVASFDEESLRLGCQMSRAIPATVLGSTVTLLLSSGKRAAPCLTSAPESSCQASVPIVAVLRR